MKAIESVVIGVGGYIAVNALVFYPSIGAVDYFEAMGYINGLVRGAGSKAAAQTKLNEWKTYWMGEHSWAKPIIAYFYENGLKRIAKLYP